MVREKYKFIGNYMGIFFFDQKFGRFRKVMMGKEKMDAKS